MKLPAPLWILVLLLRTGAVAGFTGFAAQPMRMGLLLPPEEALGRSIESGARLAASRLGTGGPGAIELVVRGRVGQWGDDGGEAGRLVIEDEVRVLIAPPGGVPAHLVLQVAGRTRTPVVMLTPEGSATGAGVPWALRLVPSTMEELRALVGRGATPTQVLVAEGRPAREVSVDVDVGSRRASDPGTPKPRVTVIPVRSTVGGGGEGEQAAQLLKHPTEPILIWLDPVPAANWARALRKAGYRGRLGGPGWLRCAEFIREAGASAEGFQLPEIDPGPDEGVMRAALREFAKDYRAATGVEPDVSAIMAAEAVGVATALIRRAGEQPVHSVFPVRDLGGGLTGPWRFDRAGNREARLRILEWTSSGWEVVAGVETEALRR